MFSETLLEQMKIDSVEFFVDHSVN